MKCFLISLLTIILIPLSSKAAGTKVDNLYYNLDIENKTAEVTYDNGIDFYVNYTNLSGTLIIPEYILYDDIIYNVTSIGSHAFERCPYMTSVEIPNSVSSIGSYAFFGCKSLTSILIPTSVTEIGKQALSSCPNLKGVKIPSSITCIGDAIFMNSGLAYVEIPNSVTSIGNHAFYGCGDLTNVIIPNSVTSIGSYAFQGCRGLTRMDIPNLVTAIENNTFEGCDGLVIVTIGNSVTSIGDRAFSRCYELESVTIPNSITSIGEEAFYACHYLSNIKIPNTVTKIGKNAFNLCSGLRKVEISDISSWCNISFDSETANPLYYAHHLYLNGNELLNLTIPNSITKIGNYAFNGWSVLKSLTISNSITEIGSKAFYKCSGLTSVSIPGSVSKIGDLAFDSCSSLKSFSLNDGNEELSFDSDIWQSKGSPIETVYMGRNISYSSARSPFYYIKDSLKEIRIGSLVTQIEKGLFDECSTLEKVNISNLEAWCNIKFEHYRDNPLYYAHRLYRNDREITDLSIGNITSIKDYTFSYCSSLKRVSIYESITEIGAYAFFACDRMTSLEFGNSLTLIGEEAFGSCRALINLEIPNSVTSIGQSAFSGCSGLTNVTIPNSVTSIGSGAFNNCNKLANLTLGDNLKEIGSMAFQNCRNLTSVKIPNSVTSIGNLAFYNCVGLEKVEITDLISWLNIDFESTTANPLYNAHHLYVNDHELTSLTIPSSITSIKNFAFTGCKGLEHILIPNSITSIGTGAFSFCGLTSVNIPNSIYCIQDNTFFGCSGLTSVKIGDSVTSIGREAFSNCSSLTSIEIPNSVTSIGMMAFDECSSLRWATIGNSVKEIGAYSVFPNSLMILIVLASTPPKTSINCFTKDTYSKCMLAVPTESFAKYQTTDPWKDFVYIQAFNGTEPDLGNDEDSYVECEKIELEYTECTMNIDVQIQNHAKIFPENTSDKTVTWLSSNPDIVKVDETGLMTALKEGFVIIMAQCGKGFATCDVEVIKGSNSDDSSLIIWDQEFRCKIGDVLKLDAYTRFETEISYKNVVPDDGYKNVIIYEDGGQWFASCQSAGTVMIEAFLTRFPNEKVRKTFNVIDNPDELLYENGIYYSYCDDVQNKLKVVRGYEIYSGDYAIPSNALGLSVVEVETQAFYSCKNLGRVVISEGIKKIGYESFGNGSIYEIHIPSSVTEIKDWAFNANKPGFKDIYLYGLNPVDVNEEIFNGYVDYERCVLHIPYGTIDKYRSAYVWSIFENIVEDIPVIKTDAIMIVPESLTLGEGTEYQLQVIFEPKNTMERTLEWKDYNPEIISVSENGLIRGLKEGKTTLTAVCGLASAKCDIEVSSDYIDDDSISFILEDENDSFTVINLQGIVLMKNVSAEKLNLLEPGSYIIISEISGKRSKVLISN